MHKLANHTQLSEIYARVIVTFRNVYILVFERLRPAMAYFEH